MRGWQLPLVVVSLAAFLAAACGGKIDDGDGGILGPDGGPRGDATAPMPTTTPTTTPTSPPTKPPPPPPPPITCSGKEGSGWASSDGSCGSENKWTCKDGHTYGARCECPKGTCECYRDGALVQVVKYLSCPGCAATDPCPFPQ